MNRAVGRIVRAEFSKERVSPQLTVTPRLLPSQHDRHPTLRNVLKTCSEPPNSEPPKPPSPNPF
jgi:hypothetical protein